MQKLPSQDWKQVFELLDVAFELPEAERGSWLATLGDVHSHLVPALRELLAQPSKQETNDFLRKSLVPEGFLQHLPQFTQVGEATPGATAFGLKAGDVVGAYRLLRELGRGGMGEVWLAERSDGRFDGRCALKFLESSTSSQRFAERFRREGNLLARLTHPCIARLLDAGATETGQPYLALEYVDGERIDRYCDANSLSVNDRVRLFTEVVTAVAHAHTHLIVHRDLKPSNVLVTKDGAVKLLDFGIAKLLTADQATHEVARTRLEEVALTPEYAAPEQLLGELPTTATDVYQLGLLLFVLLAGELPHQSRSRAERIRGALNESIPRASDTADESIRGQLRGDLDAILAMALRKMPIERYATAQALKDELLRFLNHEPVTARRGASWYRMHKFVERHRVAVTGSVIAALGLFAAVIFSVMQMREAQAQRDQSRFAAARAEASSQFMSLMLEEVGSGNRPLTMPELLARAEQLLDKQYGADQKFVATMLLDLANRYRDVGRSEKALELLRRSILAARRVGDDTLLARGLCHSAYTRLQTASSALTDSELSEALATLSRIKNPPVELTGECLRIEGRIAQSKGEFDKALTLMKTARDLYEQSGATNGLAYTGVLTNLGGLNLATGNMAESYKAFKQADDAFELNGRGGTISKLTAESNLSIPLLRMGEVLEASKLLQHVMERSAALQSSQLSRLPYLVNYASVLMRLDHAEAALKLFEDAEDQFRAESDPAFVAWGSFQFGRAMFANGNIAKAEQRIDDAERTLKENPVPNALYLRTISLERVRNDLSLGKPDQARQRIDALLHDLRYPEALKVQSKPGPELRAVLLAAAEVYLKANQTAPAREYAQGAYEIALHLARSADKSADVGEAALLISRIEQTLGHSEKIQPLLEQAVTSLRNGLGADHPLTLDASERLAALR